MKKLVIISLFALLFIENTDLIRAEIIENLTIKIK